MSNEKKSPDTKTEKKAELKDKDLDKAVGGGRPISNQTNVTIPA